MQSATADSRINTLEVFGAVTMVSGIVAAAWGVEESDSLVVGLLLLFYSCALGAARFGIAHAIVAAREVALESAKIVELLSSEKR